MSFLSLAWRDRFRRRPVRERSSTSLLVRRWSSSTGRTRSCSRATWLSTAAHCTTKSETVEIQDSLWLLHLNELWWMYYSPSCLQLWCSAVLLQLPRGWWNWSRTHAAHGCTPLLSEGATATRCPLASEQPQWKWTNPGSWSVRGMNIQEESV